MTIRIDTDPRQGGRWTSLRAGEREWLWRQPDPVVQRARDVAVAGDDFVDAGGAEECFPTVRGTPDHGAAWTARWSSVARSERCEVDGSRLQRTVTETGTGTAIDYRIDGPPGLRFTHAVHALLDLGPQARIGIDGRPQIRVLDHPTVQQATWPMLAEVDISRLVPVDGTAYALIIDCSDVLVVDGRDRLRFGWEVIEGDAPMSLLFWRNLDGWPPGAPYRTIGIEPMIGRTAEPAAEPDAAAVLGPSGALAWRLTLTDG